MARSPIVCPALLVLSLSACCSPTEPKGSTGSTTATSAGTASSGAASTGAASTGASATGGSATGGSSGKASASGGTASGSTGSASGTGTGGSSTGATTGTPIVATANQWTWVPFSDAVCANGAPTGIGLNPNAADSPLLIYLEGGGACWDQLTCYTLMTASYFTTGYGSTEFQTESTDPSYLAMPGGFFDRTSAGNPFKDYSFVYVPYCTGDIHAGNNVVQYGTNTANFVGFANIAAYLERLVPTFAGAPSVVLAGSSAGGYGALYNWWQVQQAFGAIGVTVIDDSGTFMPPDVEAEGGGYSPLEVAAWNLTATLPPGCTGCSTNLDALNGFYASTFPNQRGALLSYTMDSTLPSFIGITTAQFTTGLDEDASTYFDPSADLRYFFYSGSGHVLWFNPQLTQNGVTLETFITQMVTGDANWASVHP